MQVADSTQIMSQLEASDPKSKNDEDKKSEPMFKPLGDEYARKLLDGCERVDELPPDIGVVKRCTYKLVAVRQENEFCVLDPWDEKLPQRFAVLKHMGWYSTVEARENCFCVRIRKMHAKNLNSMCSGFTSETLRTANPSAAALISTHLLESHTCIKAYCKCPYGLYYNRRK